MKRIFLPRFNEIMLFLSLAASFPLLFENALEHSSPMGYAGLFMQMAEQIAASDFLLPASSPYYGPGGIPFAYPPLGLYLLAIPIKLIGKYFIFLRFIPPLLSLIALVPLFYLVLELSDSPIAASIAVILTAASNILYVSHAWAAGITRAPAFMFTLVSLCFFFRQINKPSALNLFFTGVFGGLALMSHLMYALFCFMWIWWWALFHGDLPFFARLRHAIFSSIIGILTASVWLTTIFQRHGIQLFFHVLDSHGGGKLFSFWKSADGLFRSFKQNIEPITSHEILFLLVLLGAVALLLKRRYVIVSFTCFIILVFPDNARFVYLLGAIFAGMGVSILIDWIHTISNRRLKPLILFVLTVPLLGVVWWDGYKTISRYTPHLSRATLDLAEYAQSNTDPHETYLALIRQDEAEWLPYLFQREPIVSQWGSEWLGEYYMQTYLMSLFRGCQREQSWTCVENAIAKTGRQPYYLITYVRDRHLNNQLLELGEWEQIYENDRYIAWSRTN